MLFANWVLTALIFLPLIEGSIRADPTDLSQSNSHVTVTWQLTEKGMPKGTLTQIDSKESVPLTGELFTVALSDGTTLRSSEMKIVRAAQLQPLTGNATAPRRSEQSPGSELVLELEAQDKSLHATWRSILRDGSNYLREEVTLAATDRPVPLKGIVLLDLPMADASTTGAVEGSPVATKTIFFAAEHPLSINTSDKGQVRCFLPHGAALTPGKKLDASAIIGFARDGQMRRDFLAYLERERAHPYRSFLTYNTWYDLGYFNRYTEAGLLDRIHSFGEELVEKRQIKLDSLLLDDGWDDPKTLWKPNRDFPNGFGADAQSAQKYGAHLGFWLSPWGGYGGPKKERLSNGAKEGFEIANGSFSMAGPKYYERFHSLCVDVVKNYGVNQFKFDGIGSDSGDDEASVTGGGDAIRDFEAMLDLIADLRALKPDIFINQTTGTWPSPFWLFDADSIWRGGDDHAFAGVGTPRQRWITYRDGDVYQRIVSRSKLYPLNSLMLHGIIYAQKAHDLNLDPQGDFTAEVRSFFGTGTQMQELYITPSLLTAANWDALAESARWSHANADVLQDTHWVGGDPVKGQIYGWASWSPRKGILTLRNPSDKAATVTIDAGTVFELPSDAAQDYELVSPYKDQRLSGISLKTGTPYEFTLEPFEVLVFDANPTTPGRTGAGTTP